MDRPLELDCPGGPGLGSKSESLPEKLEQQRYTAISDEKARLDFHVNVLQAMIITDKDKMVLTPTYHVFKMYVPFQDATFVPVTFDAGWYTNGAVALPRLDVIAAKDSAGTLWLAVTNLDPNRPADLAVRLSGISARTAAGETLTAAAVDAVNTVQAPTLVAPKPILAGRSDHPDARTEVGDRHRSPMRRAGRHLVNVRATW